MIAKLGQPKKKKKKKWTSLTISTQGRSVLLKFYRKLQDQNCSWATTTPPPSLVVSVSSSLDFVLEPSTLNPWKAVSTAAQTYRAGQNGTPGCHVPNWSAPEMFGHLSGCNKLDESAAKDRLP